MKDVYLVVHSFTVDGGFGDAIPGEEAICVFESLEEAEKFTKSLSATRIYDRPYAELDCGTLCIRELPFYREFETVPDYEWDNPYGYGPDSLELKEDSE